MSRKPRDEGRYLPPENPESLAQRDRERRNAAWDRWCAIIAIMWVVIMIGSFIGLILTAQSAPTFSLVCLIVFAATGALGVIMLFATALYALENSR